MTIQTANLDLAFVSLTWLVFWLPLYIDAMKTFTLEFKKIFKITPDLVPTLLRINFTSLIHQLKLKKSGLVIYD